ncbi:MAG: class I SAM-dependent methyltransferase [Bacteroidales bacterium]|nr:class I SAM-dependent methyltransferase [Bacteroidales bacterium]MCF6341607.1 class I SAM-dependent methyltransferase [Bacteroidales bacterium]
MKKIEDCPVCGKNEFSPFLETRDYFLTQEVFSLVQCKHCSFVFTNPRPLDNKLHAYYNSPDYLSHTVDSFSFTGAIYKRLRNANIRNKFKLVNSFKQGKKLLDIGCGTGELLSYFKNKGWEVKGIEPNKSARSFAQKSHHLDVIDETGLDKLEPESFDVISMWHVLEHVPDLNGRMMQLNKLLNKEGRIVIALPNLGSPDARKYGAFWAGLDVPRHLYHFTQSTLQLLLKKHEMELVGSFPLKFDAYYVSLLSEKYLKRKVPYFPAFVNGLRSNFNAKKNNNYSSMIFVIKQKT